MSGAYLFALAAVFLALPASGWHLRQHASGSLVRKPLTNDNVPDDFPEFGDDDVANLEAGGDSNDDLDEDSDLQDPTDVSADAPMEMSEDSGDMSSDDMSMDDALDAPVKTSLHVVPKAVKVDHLLTQKHVKKSMQKDHPHEQAGKRIKDALDKAGALGSRPLMNTINVMRAEFCLRRPDLLEHEKCLKFLLKRCMIETSGYGYCTEFHEILEKACDEGKVLPGEKAKCEYHDQLHTVVKPGGEEPTEAPPPEPTTTIATTTAATTTAATTTAVVASEEPEPDSQELTVEDGEGVEMDDGGDADGDGDGASAGAGAGAAASPAPAAAGTPAGAAPAPAPAPLPPATSGITNFDKKWRDLPDQGYDEHSDPKWVQHQDFDTQTEDWQKEWPSWDETEGQSTARICEERPDHLWCKLYLKDREGGEASRVPAASHSAASHSSSTSEKKTAHKKAHKKAHKHERVTEKKAVQEQKEETQGNLDGGVDATGDQAAEAADEMSAALPPGMFPTDEDVGRDMKVKGKGMSKSGQDLPPGMLTHPDDMKKDLAFKAEKKQGRHETAFGDDDDFVDDNSDADESVDDPEDIEEGVDSAGVADGDSP